MQSTQVKVFWFSIYQSFDQHELILLDMFDSEDMCYSTLELANLQRFTLVVGLIYN